MHRLLSAILLCGCAADQPAPQTSEVGVTVLPVASATTPAPLSHSSATAGRTSSAPSAPDRQAAERYFAEARSLLNSGQVEQACALFQKSLEAEVAIGTMLNLAACHEQLGNIPEACSAYREVQAQARGLGQDDRGAFALARADELGCR